MLQIRYKLYRSVHTVPVRWGNTVGNIGRYRCKSSSAISVSNTFQSTKTPEMFCLLDSSSCFSWPHFSILYTTWLSRARISRRSTTAPDVQLGTASRTYSWYSWTSSRKTTRSRIRPKIILGTAHRLGWPWCIPVSPNSHYDWTVKLKWSLYLGMSIMCDMVSELSLPAGPFLYESCWTFFFQSFFSFFFFSLSSFLWIGKVSLSTVCYQSIKIIVGQSRIKWMISMGDELGGPSRGKAMMNGQGISLILKSIELRFRRPVTYPDTVSNLNSTLLRVPDLICIVVAVNWIPPITSYSRPGSFYVPCRCIRVFPRSTELCDTLNRYSRMVWLR